MHDFKIGDSVVCMNSNIAEDCTGMVGEIVATAPSVFLDRHVAIIEYPNGKKKIPFEELELYEPEHDANEIKISREKFKEITRKHFGIFLQSFIGARLQDVENELFGVIEE